MAIINSVGNLLGAVNSKADAITSVAKGVLCIPSILSQFPNTLAGIGTSLVSSISKQLGSIVAGIQDTILSTVTSALNQITGIVSNTIDSVLQIGANVLGAIALVKETIAGFKKRIDDVASFIKDKENCKFAGASLAKCMIGSIAGDVTKNIASSIQKGQLSTTSLISNISVKLSSPQSIITQYAQKTENTINKAAAQINATRLL